MTSPSSDMGGAEKTFWFLSSRLKADDRFEIYGAFPFGGLYSRLKLNFKKVQLLFSIEFIPRTRGLFMLIRWPWYVLTLTVNFLLCLKEILLNRIDVVYVNSSIQLSAVLAAVLTKRKLVVFIMEDYFYDNSRLREWLFLFLSRRADKLICQSSKIKNAILEAKKKIEVIYSGVYDIEEKQSTFCNADLNYFKVGIIGKIYPLKGQETFIKAIGHLVQEGLPVKGYIYGNCRRFSPNYLYLHKLKNYINMMKLEKRISFAGQQSLRLMYERLDTLVIASQSESSPLVFSEALKFGKPVISTRTGVMADVGKDGENLLFFNFGDNKDLADRIKKLYMDRDLRKRLIENGRILYQKEFNEAVIAERFVNILKEVSCEDRN